MRATSIHRYLLALVLATATSLCLLQPVVAENFPTCSGVVCSADGVVHAQTVGGVSHCCTSGTNNGYLTCSTPQTCTVAAVALFSSANCAGSATFRAIAMTGSAKVSTACVMLPDGSASWPVFQAGTDRRTGTAYWQISQYASCDTTGNSIGTAVGVVGDFGCYNLVGGSVVVDSTATAASKVGQTISSPPANQHPSVQFGSTYAPAASDVASFARWPGNACQDGSAPGQYTGATSCSSSSATSTIAAGRFKIACASRATNAEWTLSTWLASDSASASSRCSAGNIPADAVQRGQGLQCVPLSPAGSVIIDCTVAALQNHYTNYVTVTPAVPGGWSDWTACTEPCGGGTQTRRCDSPAPSGNGATCVGASEQTCNTAACSDPSTASSTGAGADSSTSTGADSSTSTGADSLIPAGETTNAATSTLSPSGSILFFAGAAVVANGMRAVL